MRCLAAAVPKEKAEEVRQALLARGLLRKGLAAEREGDVVYFPITAQVDVVHPVVERDFREKGPPICSYKDVVQVPPELRSLLPTSFDVVGDIAILKIPEELHPHETAIAEAILRTCKAVKVVAADAGVKGQFRLRQVRILAGPDRTETVHREYGLSYKVDLTRAYFSPRFGSERLRVAVQVREDETVVDMFSGVGPFAVLIGRRRQPEVVHAFDANPDAFRYLEENVRINRADRVRPRLGDALELLPTVDPPKRIIVDYPFEPDDAYRVALQHIRPGGVIHYYVIMEMADLEDRERFLVDSATQARRRAQILDRREVHGWSATQKLYAFDVRVT